MTFLSIKGDMHKEQEVLEWLRKNRYRQPELNIYMYMLIAITVVFAMYTGFLLSCFRSEPTTPAPHPKQAWKFVWKERRKMQEMQVQTRGLLLRECALLLLRFVLITTNEHRSSGTNAPIRGPTIRRGRRWNLSFCAASMSTMFF